MLVLVVLHVIFNLKLICMRCKDGSTEPVKQLTNPKSDMNINTLFQHSIICAGLPATVRFWEM